MIEYDKAFDGVWCHIMNSGWGGTCKTPPNSCGTCEDNLRYMEFEREKEFEDNE
jgi:hypothetical protein